MFLAPGQSAYLRGSVARILDPALSFQSCVFSGPAALLPVCPPAGQLGQWPTAEGPALFTLQGKTTSHPVGLHGPRAT